ncbi:bifunctional adenosylcobinamide kinase/adenosylcobinamide-phosphate guanylyltransferase [Kaistia algarum]|uniref:bifunctional adenosylcobinamide kinase/adenosylcobinamide-phosphate guanylyltransferase n=1 Tax=Kaistia algarum TaxID=2083279 RepID=UPI000CE727F4|nr:bifunctional adenosylcobinamide kinase/adenosylcobinamide-phosphate guanylyltransferase [Kaistia algarum]MCX5514888.1 bifunctional adenosylcobinamide kinase/adenosylcobinamide-phosphate guanylyltransferase [Kaistia algarum]PPE79639.1 bifunctional adenosylcobinamide kinase/adenosylcobinamide-phosphate guanylyltransferase [Kaistia algarum]
MEPTIPPPRTALVLGGARSGKSRFAETIVQALARPVVYVATAEARDQEMGERIALHRARRGDWATIEAPLDLVGAIARAEGRAVLVDCLTLWLSNLLEAGRDPEAEGERLAACLDEASVPIVLVSNEVGSGIVPMNALARRFADEQGRLNQRIAKAVAQVFLVAAGLPVRLKPRSDPEYSL